MAKKILFSGLIILGVAVSLFFLVNAGSASSDEVLQSHAQISRPRLSIRSASGKVYEFQTQNGRIRYGSDPEKFKIPHLTLFSNASLADRAQRTLNIEISGIQLPSPGATVSLLVETQHGDPDFGSHQGERIAVWQEFTWVTGNKVTLRHTFSESVIRNGIRIPTPSGYFRYQIRFEAHNAQLYTFEKDYAFLMENQWVATLPDVPETSPGAAPDELVIYYADMTPFQKSIHDPATWVARRDVRGYVGRELLPAFVEAFRLQSAGWGFPWHTAWTSRRSGSDAERISVALTDGHTWYHGEAYSRGSSRISINVTGSENYNYDTLTDGLLSTFHHELFHNQQRSLNQHYGGDGWIGGKNEQWQFIAEGTAVLASAVAQPKIQFAAEARERAYMTNANLYLGGESMRSDIGRDFNEISPYHAALYWRFLYEACGGMAAGRENPAQGMQIIRRVLTRLYQTPEGEAGWPRIMDQALSGSACPFQTYTESLDAFAQAIDSLRFDNRRCQSPGLPEGCGFYDPHNLYNDPPANVLALMAGLP